MRVARRADGELLLPVAEIPRRLRQHHHLGLGHLPILPEAQGRVEIIRRRYTWSHQTFIFHRIM